MVPFLNVQAKMAGLQLEGVHPHHPVALPVAHVHALQHGGAGDALRQVRGIVKTGGGAVHQHQVAQGVVCPDGQDLAAAQPAGAIEIYC